MTRYHRRSCTEIVRIDAAAGRRAHGAHAHARGALGAGARRAALSAVRRGEAAPAVRDEPAGKAAGSWTWRLEAFGQLVDYEVGEVTAAATFYMAEIYRGLQPRAARVRAPGRICRPASSQEYEIALEEEAFPFEEQAIKVHEKNLELMRSGYLQRLDRQEPRPPRRADAGALCEGEISSGFLGSIDRYAYRSPHAAAPSHAATTDAAAGSTPRRALRRCCRSINAARHAQHPYSRCARARRIACASSRAARTAPRGGEAQGGEAADQR